MKNKDLMKVISISLASFSIGLCLFIWGQVSGYYKGYFYGVFQNPPPTAFDSSGPNFFQTINTWYFIIAFGFCIYIVGKFLKPFVVSSVFCIFSLCIGFYPYWDMFAYKKRILSLDVDLPYEYWLNNSIYFDWFLLFATVSLMVVQVILFNTRKLDNETLQIT